MDNIQRNQLLSDLVRYIKVKFASRKDIVSCAEDIVNDAFIQLLQSSTNSIDKENFGYLSKASLRVAFKYLSRINTDIKMITPLNKCLGFISEDDFVDEMVREEDTKEILESLEVLKQIERIIITQRYFGELRFYEIAEKNNLNLNTVKSHHRRALEKLRRSMTKNIKY